MTADHHPHDIELEAAALRAAAKVYTLDDYRQSPEFQSRLRAIKEDHISERLPGIWELMGGVAMLLAILATIGVWGLFIWAVMP